MERTFVVQISENIGNVLELFADNTSTTVEQQIQKAIEDYIDQKHVNVKPRDVEVMLPTEATTIEHTTVKLVTSGHGLMLPGIEHLFINDNVFKIDDKVRLLIVKE